MADLHEDRVESTHTLHTVLLWAIHSRGKKKGTEQIHSDIHLHEFLSSAHRAVR